MYLLYVPLEHILDIEIKSHIFLEPSDRKQIDEWNLEACQSYLREY